MPPYPSLAELDAQRATERRRLAVERARKVLDQLAERGVEAAVVGSLARGDFGRHSDVDFLVLSTGGLEDPYLVDDWVADIMGEMPFDVIYWQEVPLASRREQLLSEARHGSDLG